ncbi:MAG: hypothetical protein AB7O96_13830 [Pseudobdellovibrionaceae bacterium]
MYKAIIIMMVLAATLFSVGCADRSDGKRSKYKVQKKTHVESNSEFIGIWKHDFRVSESSDIETYLQEAETSYYFTLIDANYEVTYLSFGLEFERPSTEDSITTGKLSFLTSNIASLVHDKENIKKYIESRGKNLSSEQTAELWSALGSPQIFKFENGKLGATHAYGKQSHTFNLVRVSQEEFAKTREEVQHAREYLSKNEASFREALGGNSFELVEIRKERSKENEKKELTIIPANKLEDEEMKTEDYILIYPKRLIFEKDGKKLSVNEKYALEAELRSEKNLEGLILNLQKRTNEDQKTPKKYFNITRGILVFIEGGFTITDSNTSKGSVYTTTTVYKRVK